MNDAGEVPVALSSELPNYQIWDHLKVAEVEGSDGVTEVQSRDSDLEVCKRYHQTLLPGLRVYPRPPVDPSLW